LTDELARQAVNTQLETRKDGLTSGFVSSTAMAASSSSIPFVARMLTPIRIMGRNKDELLMENFYVFPAFCHHQLMDEISN
jgi:hypothetical protein